MDAAIKTACSIMNTQSTELPVLAVAWFESHKEKIQYLERIFI